MDSVSAARTTPAPLADVWIAADDAEALAVGAQRFAVRRAWPRSAEHVLLEFAGADGARVAGQWWADGVRATNTVRRTRRDDPEAHVAAVRNEAEAMLTLHAHGCDRALPGVRPLVAAGASVVAHQPGRRAVLRDRDGAWYAKVVPAARLPRLAALAHAAAPVAGAGVRVPTVREADFEGGVLFMDALPGVPFHDRLQGPEAGAVATALGAALRRLHAIVVRGLDEHGPSAEATVLRTRYERACALRPEWRDVLPPARVEAVIARLDADPQPFGTVHRDLYDKQVLVDDGAPLGLLDFDTMARGEPALDIANVLGHFELRAHQARMTPARAAVLSQQFVDAYDPDAATRDRLPTWLEATRVRLACVYAVRPPWPDVPGALLAPRDAHPG